MLLIESASFHFDAGKLIDQVRLISRVFRLQFIRLACRQEAFLFQLVEQSVHGGLRVRLWDKSRQRGRARNQCQPGFCRVIL